mgnify:FL=1|jgi:hypothetical protein
MALMAKRKLRTLGRQESITPKKINKQVLITSGCSFTETQATETWPIHLQRMLVDETRFSAHELISLGLGSQGNGLISRKLIHGVHEQLKVKEPKDIIACVMWSGPSRHEQFTTDKRALHLLHHGPNTDKWQIQPTTVTSTLHDGGWILYNAHWKIPQARNYYRYIYDEVYSQIQTLEHIIRVQNYLKLHNITYTMGVMNASVLKLREHSSLDHLYEQIDFDQFFDTSGMFEWTVASRFGPGEHELMNKHGGHPTSQQHQKFVQDIILPHLKEKINIDKVN